MTEDMQKSVKGIKSLAKQTLNKMNEIYHGRNVTPLGAGDFKASSCELLGSGCNFGSNVKQDSPPSLQNHCEVNTKQIEAVLTKL